MNGPGMWMPKRKDGKNWAVSYSIVLDGERHDMEKKFRVRKDAAEFIKRSKSIASRDERVSEFTFNQPSKLEG